MELVIDSNEGSYYKRNTVESMIIDSAYPVPSDTEYLSMFAKCLVCFTCNTHSFNYDLSCDHAKFEVNV